MENNEVLRGSMIKSMHFIILCHQKRASQLMISTIFYGNTLLKGCVYISRALETRVIDASYKNGINVI